MRGGTNSSLRKPLTLAERQQMFAEEKKATARMLANMAKGKIEPNLKITQVQPQVTHDSGYDELVLNPEGYDSPREYEKPGFRPMWVKKSTL
jgi:hypothetical protein